MAGTIKVDSINADSNLALKIANTAVAFIDSSGLRPTSGNVSLDATATSKLYLPSANTVAIQTAGVTAVTVDSSQNVTLAGTLTTTGITNSGVATGARFNPTGSSVTGNGMYLPAANSLGLSTNGTNAVYIDSSQNVGIGTSSPNANLQVNGGIQVTGTPSIGSTGVGVEIGYGLVNASEGAIQAYNRSGSAWINMAYSALAHKFLANNSEAMRIDSSGNLLVGQTTQTGNEKFGVTQSAASSFAAYFNATAGNYGYDVVKIRCARGSATNEYNFINCLQVSTLVFQVLASGNVQNTNNSYGAISDIKLKENIVDATPKLADLMQVKVRNYNLKSDPTHKQIGVIAQELEQVFPAMVEEATDKDEEGNSLGTTTKGVKYSVFVPMLVKAIQELKAINDTQAETINALTARIVALETI
jgi:putative sterol carrier protein